MAIITGGPADASERTWNGPGSASKAACMRPCGPAPAWPSAALPQIQSWFGRSYGWSFIVRPRSADFQSAVPQICNLRGVKGSGVFRAAGSPADYKSAEQQIENLRYGSRPVARPFRTL